MAMQKEKTLLNGATGNYWKVTHVTCDKMAMEITVVISLFLDSTHRMGKDLGLSKTFKEPVTKNELATDITSLAYAKVKARAETLLRYDVFTGDLLETPIYSDPDLAGATEV